MSSSSSEDEVNLTRWLNKPKTQFESALSSDENIFSDEEAEALPDNGNSTSEEGDSDDSSDGEPENKKIKASNETSSRTICLSNAEKAKREVDRIIAQHKANLKGIVEKEKQRNEEFINVMHYLKNGGTSIADNETQHPPVIKGGINLSQVPADENPSLFGRKLAVLMFGDKADCELRYKMIGKKSVRSGSRPLISKEDQEKFELVVRRKFPKIPSYAYEEARKAANQMGTDFKRRYATTNH